MKHRFSAIFLSLAAIVGCKPPDVEGDWDGTWRSGAFEGDMDITLTQDGDTLGGTFQLGGTWCVGEGKVTGTIDDQRHVTITLSNEVGGEVEIDGKVSATDDKIEGDFVVTGGFCEDAKGKVELTRE